jgi:hypothetical protein
MKALETTRTITLPDARVAVCGDWHGNLAWLRTLTPAIAALAPEVTTVLQLGDWWMDTNASDRIFTDAGIERVYVTLGNHEPWGNIIPLQRAHPGEAVRVSDVTWLLPRPARLHIGGREMLSLGGAASVDREWRTEGIDWWPDENITDAHVATAIEGGPADVMLTHESPAGTPIHKVREVLRTNPLGFPETARIESALSRRRIRSAWDAVRPELLLHGHMHIPGAATADDGRRVISMGCDGQQGNLALLDTRTLELEIPSLRALRAAIADSSEPGATRSHQEAVTRLAGSHSGAYPPMYLEELREGWNE